MRPRVADFGCGDAELARKCPEFEFSSLDLVAGAPGDVFGGSLLLASQRGRGNMKEEEAGKRAALKRRGVLCGGGGGGGASERCVSLADLPIPLLFSSSPPSPLLQA